MSLIFISHSSQDNAVADEMRRRLAEQGHNSVFLDFNVKVDGCTPDPTLTDLQVLDLTQDGTERQGQGGLDRPRPGSDPGHGRGFRSRHGPADTGLPLSGSDGEERTVEVAHEALFHAWGQLASWLEESREALHLQHEGASRRSNGASTGARRSTCGARVVCKGPSS